MSISKSFPCARYIFIVFILLAGGTSIAGCSSFGNLEQPALHSQISLEHGSTIGQTFVPRYDGFSGFSFFLEPDKPGTGTIQLKIRSNPVDKTVIRRAELDVEQVRAPGYYRFDFQPIVPSAGENFYATFSVRGEGKFRVGSAEGNSYLQGSSYQGGTPLDAQLSFGLNYNFAEASLGLLKEGVIWIGYIIVAALLFVIPGWATLSLVWRNWGDLKWEEKLGLGIGVSIALQTLLFLVFDFLSIRHGRLAAWAPGVIGLFLVTYVHRWKIPQIFSTQKSGLRINNLSTWLSLVDLILIFGMFLIFFTRIWAIRNLSAPMWGDSVQHTVIAQLILDHRGLFDSWEPYANFQSLTVHYGFSGSVALFSWISGIPAVQATLIVGQLMNLMAAITIIPLAMRLSGNNRWAGVAALIIVGLFTYVPAYYVNWGRYAQLAGLVIIPVAIRLFCDSVDPSNSAPINRYIQPSAHSSQLKHFSSESFLAGLVITGMILNYYRMAFFFAAYVLSWLIGWGITNWKFDYRSWQIIIFRIFLTMMVSVIFFLPWYQNMSGGKLSSAISADTLRIADIGSGFDGIIDELKLLLDTTSYVPPTVLWLVGIAILWSLIRKQWWISSIILWIGILIFYTIGRRIGLPGANMMQNFAILISLYLPASLMCGWLIGEVASWLINLRFGKPALVILTLPLAIFGTSRTRSIAHPDIYAMVSQPDLNAMLWIRDHTSGSATFLIEGFSIFNRKSTVGSDAGWWIPLYTKRLNTIPPQYALLNEEPVDPGYPEMVAGIVNTLEDNPIQSFQSAKVICQAGVNYIYIGQYQGNVGAGVRQLFTPEDLLSVPSFKVIYHQDRVYIFEISPEYCANEDFS